MKCRNCGSEIDEKAEVIGKGKKAPSYWVKCPTCGRSNHVKCRYKNGQRKTVRISESVPGSL